MKISENVGSSGRGTQVAALDVHMLASGIVIDDPR